MSIVIPARNESANLGSLLESLVAADLGTHTLAEIAVYDDLSTDDTLNVVESVAARHPVIRLIRGEARLGCTGAVQRLIRESRGEAIVRMNADVAICEDAVRLLADAIEAGASLAIGAQSPQLTRVTVPGLAASFSFHAVERLKAGRYRRHYAVGHLVAVRRDMIADLTFPADVINEDHFLAMHVFRKGGAIVHVPVARCRVRPASTFSDYWRVSRRVLEGERQLHRTYGFEPTPMTALVSAVLATAVHKPVQFACWAALYPLSSSLPTPARNSAWDTVRSTKGRIA